MTATVTTQEISGAVAGAAAGIQRHLRTEVGDFQALQKLSSDFCLKHRGRIVVLTGLVESASDRGVLEAVS